MYYLSEIYVRIYNVQRSNRDARLLSSRQMMWPSPPYKPSTIESGERVVRQRPCTVELHKPIYYNVDCSFKSLYVMLFIVIITFNLRAWFTRSTKLVRLQCAVACTHFHFITCAACFLDPQYIYDLQIYIYKVKSSLKFMTLVRKQQCIFTGEM
jgi:hypothetical protein